MTKLAIGCLALLLAAKARAQPEETRQDVVRAEAPIVAGNAVNAKKLAIASALRQAAEQSYADIIKEGAPIPSPMPPAIAQLRASLASSPQRYVRSYRLIEQKTEGGMLRVMVEVDVDAVALRRAIDRALGTATVHLQPVNRTVANVIYIAGSSSAASVLAASFGALGVRAQIDPSPTEAQLLTNAAKQNARAIFIVAQSKGAESLRGAFRVPVKCSLGWRLFGAGLRATHGPLMTRTDHDFGFGKDEASARKACFESVAQTVARDANAAIRSPVTSLPFVTLKLDIPNVGAVPIVLHALKRLGTSAANEVRQITATAAEIRVFTRTSGPMLQQALARELGGKLQFVPVQTSIDQIVAKVRGADAPPL